MKLTRILNFCKGYLFPGHWLSGALISTTLIFIILLFLEKEGYFMKVEIR